MIALLKVVKENSNQLSCAERVNSVYNGVFNVGSASMMVSMRRPFVWNSFVLIVGSKYVRSGKMWGSVFLSIPFLRSQLYHSMAREYWLSGYYLYLGFFCAVRFLLGN